VKERLVLVLYATPCRGTKKRRGQVRMSVATDGVQSHCPGYSHGLLSSWMTAPFGEGELCCDREVHSSALSSPTLEGSPLSSLGGESATLTVGGETQTERDSGSDSACGTEVNTESRADCGELSPSFTGVDMNGVVESAASLCMLGIDECRIFRFDQVVRVPQGKMPLCWVVATVTLDDWYALQRMWDALTLSNAGMGCKAWMLFDEMLNSWIGVFLIGVIENSKLSCVHVTPEDIMSTYLGLKVDSSVFSVLWVAVLPWSEYRSWRSRCDNLLSASATTLESGRGVDDIESDLHHWMESCYMLSYLC